MLKSLCSQTWTDINIYLMNREVKYCCKSDPIPFPQTLTVDWLMNNDRLNQRKKYMLEGKFHKDCMYCYDQEKEQGTSYRTLRHESELEPLILADPNKTFVKRIELSFDNICNQSCLYCGPMYSSKIAEEQNVAEKYKYFNEQELDIIVDWLSQLETNEDTLIKILGGEPTSSKNYFYFLDKLLASEARNKKITMFTVTNGNTADKIYNKFDDYFNDSPNWRWGFGLSNESQGKVSEILRYGLDYDRYLKSLEFYASNPKVHWVCIAMAVNRFSIKSMPDFFNDVDTILKKYDQEYNFAYNWVRYPLMMNPKYLPSSFKSYIEQTRQLAQQTTSKLHKQGFYYFLDEINKTIGTEESNMEELHSWIDIKNKEKNYSLDTNLLLEQIS